MDTLLIVGLVLAAILAVVFIVLVLVGLALGILGGAVLVAAMLFEWASEQGFIGVAVYLACWVFMFPVMIIICLGGAVLMWLVERQEERDANEPRSEEKEAKIWEEQDMRYEEAKAKLVARQKEREE